MIARLGLLLLLLAPMAGPLLTSPSAASLDPAREAALLGRTLWVSAMAALVALGLGGGGAALLAHRNLPGRGLWLLLAMTPLLVPPYLWALAWTRLGAPTGQPLVASLLLGGCLYPLVLAPALLALERCPSSLVDQALLSRGEAWRSVLLPLAAPFLGLGTLLVFLIALGEYGVPSLLRVDTWAVEIFTLLNGYHDLPAAARASLGPLLAGLAAALLAARMAAAGARPLFTPQGSPPATLDLEPGGRTRGVLAAAGALALLVGLPLGLLYREADRFPLALWQAGPDLLGTLGSCALAAGLATAAGAWLAASRNLWLGGPVLALLAFPPALLALGWAGAAGGEPGLLAFGLAARALPLTFLLLLASYLSVPGSLDEAARMRAASWPTRFVQMHRPALRLAFALAFALALGDLTLGLLLTPPGAGTLAVRIFQLQHYGQPDLVATLCLVQVGVGSSPLLAAAAWNALEEP